MMDGPADSPILYLDVDGTLIPFHGRPAHYDRVAAQVLLAPGDDGSGNPLLDRLDPTDRSRLQALGCRLV